MSPRRIVLVLLLAATLVATFRSWRGGEGEVVEATAKAERVRATPSAVAHARLAAPPEDRRLGAPRGDLFPAQTWRPPPPPARPARPARVEAPPPLPPAPPPLPFVYMGHWREKGQVVYFLTQGSRVLPIQVGETLYGWRLDQASDKALTFTWTALDMQQTMRIAP